MGPPPRTSRQEQPQPATTRASHYQAAIPPVSSERWLRWAVLALLLLALAVRVPLLVNARLDRDETEHLHAAWAVAHGQVPYRDFWQLHTPLLYYLLAPVFTVMGEDLRIIYVARGLMLLCLGLTLLQLYRIARRCFDALTGLLAVLLLSYLWLWWRPAYDVRPDIPQTLVILWGLSRFMRAWERDSPRDFAVAGAILGVGFWLLVKTLFPLAGLTLVFVLSAAFRRSATAVRENLRRLGLFLGAFALPVGLGCLLLWVAGAWPGFLKWVVVGSFGWPEHFSPLPLMQLNVHFTFWALALVGVGQTVTRMVRAKTVDEVRLAPLLAGTVTAAVYLFLMPAPHPQSALSFLPLAAMYGAAVVRSVVGQALRAVGSANVALGNSAARVTRPPARPAWAGLAVLLLVGVCVPPLRAMLREMPPLTDQWAERRQVIRYVLALTSPDDCVFDESAVNIFRPHATYHYYIATAQRIWLQSGLIREQDLMNDLLKRQCKVVIFSSRTKWLPQKLYRFLLSHYVYTGVQGQGGWVMVAGRLLERSDLEGNGATVSLIASAEYAVRATGGTPRISIDGQIYQGPLFLAQGDHQIAIAGDFKELVVFYSRVLAIPFQGRDRLAKDRPD